MQKIMIVGAGGIGGYLAGQLCRYTPAEVTLVARGASLEEIKSNGLTVLDCENSYTVHPALVTDNPEEAGVQDAVLLCTKSYGLEQAVKQVRPCVASSTLVLPMLNGISARRVASEILQTGIVLDGCIYIFSKIQSPGVIEKNSAMGRIEMGVPAGVAAPASLQALCDLINSAHIPCSIPEDLQSNMWMKWILMLSNAQGASYFNVPVGPLRDDPEKFAFVLRLLDEALLVAKAEGVRLPDNARQQTIDVVHSLAYESTPSLSRDLNTPGKPTELDIFGGELLRLGKKHHIPLPNMEQLMAHFADRV
ncbi:2-dehydropantoate 2-reductase [Christensenellaceae bacterium OttesenSCG-928-L17]|nr:2-dehydropantoate 2-reductase [Christensenellaceae bacterium OttesenSCG-928-L17]